jgi:hypothetical protein
MGAKVWQIAASVQEQPRILRYAQEPATPRRERKLWLVEEGAQPPQLGSSWSLIPGP